MAMDSYDLSEAISESILNDDLKKAKEYLNELYKLNYSLDNSFISNNFAKAASDNNLMLATKIKNNCNILGITIDNHLVNVNLANAIKNDDLDLATKIKNICTKLEIPPNNKIVNIDFANAIKDGNLNLATKIKNNCSKLDITLSNSSIKGFYRDAVNEGNMLLVKNIERNCLKLDESLPPRILGDTIYDILTNGYEENIEKMEKMKKIITGCKENTINFTKTLEKLSEDHELYPQIINIAKENGFNIQTRINALNLILSSFEERFSRFLDDPNSSNDKNSISLFFKNFQMNNVEQSCSSKESSCSKKLYYALNSWKFESVKSDFKLKHGLDTMVFFQVKIKLTLEFIKEINATSDAEFKNLNLTESKEKTISKLKNELFNDFIIYNQGLIKGLPSKEYINKIFNIVKNLEVNKEITLHAYNISEHAVYITFKKEVDGSLTRRIQNLGENSNKYHQYDSSTGKVFPHVTRNINLDNSNELISYIKTISKDYSIIIAYDRYAQYELLYNSKIGGEHVLRPQTEGIYTSHKMQYSRNCVLKNSMTITKERLGKSLYSLLKTHMNDSLLKVIQEKDPTFKDSKVKDLEWVKKSYVFLSYLKDSDVTTKILFSYIKKHPDFYSKFFKEIFENKDNSTKFLDSTSTRIYKLLEDRLFPKALENIKLKNAFSKRTLSNLLFMALNNISLKNSYSKEDIVRICNLLVDKYSKNEPKYNETKISRTQLSHLILTGEKLVIKTKTKPEIGDTKPVQQNLDLNSKSTF